MDSFTYSQFNLYTTMYKYKRNLNHIKLIHYYHIISVLSCKIYIQKKKNYLNYIILTCKEIKYSK